MLKNYPATYLFLLSLIFLMALAFITPIVGGWHIVFAMVLRILNFTVVVTCGFFLLVTVIELADGMVFKKRLH